MAEHKVTRRLAAIVAIDTVGYARLMEADEVATLAQLRAIREEVVDPGIATHGGRIFKTTGDGLLIEFASAVEAVACAVEVQSALLARGGEIAFRMGINLGDVIVEGDDIYGDGVNVAARLEPLAPVGGLCVSTLIKDSVGTSLEGTFRDGGDRQLKNITRPIRVWIWSAEPRPATSALQLPTDTTIAVLPFRNLSSDPEQDYLAEALSEDITACLARLSGFVVIAWASTLGYAGSQRDLRQIGRDLGARYVVDGSVRPMAGMLRIVVQLIEAETGKHLWSDRLEYRAEEIGAVLDEVTSRIVAQLQPQLVLAQVELETRYRTADPDARTLYRQGSAALFRYGFGEKGFLQAIDLYRRALDLDPRFAQARASLSLTLAVGHVLGLVEDREEAARQAELALDDGSESEVLGYVGCALADLGDHDRGLELLERAVELNPSNAQAWVAQGAALLQKHRPEEAVGKLAYGLRISPRDPRQAIWRGIHALALALCRRLPEAIAEARAACRADQRLYHPRVVSASVLLQAGRRDEAAGALAEARRLYPGLSARTIAGIVGKRNSAALQDLDDGDGAAPSAPG